MAINTFFSIGSFLGMDVQTIVEQMSTLRKNALLAPVKQREDRLNKIKTAFDEMKLKTLNYLGSLQVLSTSLSYEARKATLTNITGTEDPTKIISVSVSSNTPITNIDVKVNQLAQLWKVQSNPIDPNATLGSLGISGTIIIGGSEGKQKSLTIDPNWKIAQLRDAINNLGVGVSAYLQPDTVDPTKVRLVLSATKTGESLTYLTAVDYEGNTLSTLGITTGAKSQKYNTGTTWYSDYFTSDTTPLSSLLGITGSGNITISWTDSLGNPQSATITINETDTLQNIANNINTTTGGNISASVVSEGGFYRLKITGAGGNTITGITESGAVNMGSALGLLKQDFANTIQSGQNATISIDGRNISSPDNVFSESETGITGLTITALKASADTIRVSIQRDLDKIIGMVQEFVNSFNNLADFIQNQVKFDEKEKTSGPLAGDISLQTLSSTMKNTILGIANWGDKPTATSKSLSLSDVGITMSGGKLSLDTAKLRSALETRFDDVVQAFALAPKDRWKSGNIFTSGSPVGGTTTTITVNLKDPATNTITPYNIAINPSVDTPEDVARKINNSISDVVAYVRKSNDTGKVEIVIYPTGGKQIESIGEDGNTFNFQQVSEVGRMAIFERARQVISGLVGDKGTVAARGDLIDKELQDIAKKKEDIEKQVEEYRVQLYMRWARAEQIVARMQAVSRSLNIIFGAIGQQNFGMRFGGFGGQGGIR